jgi:hypothetical protein
MFINDWMKEIARRHNISTLQITMKMRDRLIYLYHLDRNEWQNANAIEVYNGIEIEYPRGIIGYLLDFDKGEIK